MPFSRFLAFKARNEHLEMFDLCYMTNLSVVLQPMICDNIHGAEDGSATTDKSKTCFIWFQINYFLTHGPVYLSPFVWTASLVFHKIEKV